MSATDEPTLPTAERQALVAEWKRLQEAPPPTERREIGCMTLVIGVFIAGAGPYVLRWLGIELPASLKAVLAAVLLLAILGGAFVGLVLVSSRYSHAYREANAALEWLAQNANSGEAEERRRQTVSLLAHAYCVDGPSTVTTLDFEEARRRLGDALPYVIAAERALRIDLNIYPVFTDSKVHLPG